MTEILERLAAARIQILPALEILSHFVLERDGFVVLVERKGDAFGEIGSPGLLTERGFAPLVWRRDQPFFVSKNIDLPADGGQVEKLRLFADDVKAALK